MNEEVNHEPWSSVRGRPVNPNNLLVNLHRYASRQDENFVTEAFVHLVRHLLENESGVAVRILARLTAGVLDATAETASAVTVTTQVTTTQGRPDIEITAIDTLVYVEAKVESELGDRQLERYLEELEGKSGFRSKALVLLSRYPVEIPGPIAPSVIPRRWFLVGDWLLEELGTGSLTSDVSRYVTEQFVDFLTKRGVMMEAVGYELIDGVKSFRSLIGMVLEAVAALRVPVHQRVAAWDSMGTYLDGKNYWVGVFYDRPGSLTFTTFLLPIGTDAVEQAGSGKIQPEGYSPTKTKWVNELALDSEEVHFFARPRASQLQCVEKFLSDSIAAAQRARVQDEKQ